MASTFNIYTEITHMMEHNLKQQQVKNPTNVLMNAIVIYSFMLTRKKEEEALKAFSQTPLLVKKLVSIYQCSYL